MTIEHNQLRQIGERLSTRRGQIKMTQIELAEKTGLSVNHISIIENGTKAMRIDTMIKICSVLGLDYTYLITGNATTSKITDIQEMLSNLKSYQYEVTLDIIKAFLTDNQPGG